MSSMDVFYNVKGVGDVLMIRMETGKRNEFLTEDYGAITKITNPQGDLLGYNIFQASEHFELTGSGKVNVDEQLLNKIKELFAAQDLHDPLDVDLSPKFVVGYVTEKAAHENADKLAVCQVDIGSETLQIVCGAANVDKGQKVVVAKIGATMPGGFKIKPTTLRGVPSNGMICSKKELGLPNAEAEEGIYILDDSYNIAEPFMIG